MLSKELIEKNVDFVLQMPTLFEKVERFLLAGNLTEAVTTLQNIASFKTYFNSIFKRAKFDIPYDGNDLVVIANMLGIDTFRAIVLSYFIFLKSPKIYKVFNFKIVDLIELNAKILSDWLKVLNSFKEKRYSYLSLAPYSIACIIVCENLFSKFPSCMSDVISYSDVSYNKILQKKYGFNILDIFLKAMNMNKQSLSKIDKEMLCFFEILLSYESSRPEFYDFGVDKILDINVYPEMQTIIFIKKALQK
ncbi:hypothetical protein [Campylobacter concisus]|uniref:hypothetical protein n=1 Tax=Campylobacter concisus TaxID=199 RepID=UPI000CD9341A|nr:hypothetical protein [Campylobacter concisus]